MFEGQRSPRSQAVADFRVLGTTEAERHFAGQTPAGVNLELELGTATETVGLAPEILFLQTDRTDTGRKD